MKGGTIVKYVGGAAEEPGAAAAPAPAADDNCVGQKKRIVKLTNLMSIAIIVTSPYMASTAHEWMKKKGGEGYDLTLQTAGEISELLKKLFDELLPRKDRCNDIIDVGLGLASRALGLGFKDCKAGEQQMDGIIAKIILYFNQYFGNDKATLQIARKGGAMAMMTAIHTYISTLLLNIICMIIKRGNEANIETWRVIKIIIQTTLTFAYNSALATGNTAKNVAIAIGGGLVSMLMSMKSTILKNDSQIKDFRATVQQNPTLLEIKNTLDNLDENALVEELGVGEVEEAFENNGDLLKMMKDYLNTTIENTEMGGEDYEEHQQMRDNIAKMAGRWYDKNKQRIEDLTLSQDPDHDFDDEMDFKSADDNTITRSASAPVNISLKKYSPPRKRRRVGPSSPREAAAEALLELGSGDKKNKSRSKKNKSRSKKNKSRSNKDVNKALNILKKKYKIKPIKKSKKIKMNNIIKTFKKPTKMQYRKNDKKSKKNKREPFIEIPVKGLHTRKRKSSKKKQ
tara:strand:+ start:2966 stop:4501 length:1536 start_codon:yes stop_codon:yes gene_type:complete